jgi:hypothetical protein
MEAGNNLDITNGEAMKLLTFSLFTAISKKKKKSSTIFPHNY